MTITNIIDISTCQKTQKKNITINHIFSNRNFGDYLFSIDIKHVYLDVKCLSLTEMAILDEGIR